jgi:putative SOS response-associated peptidase YedK
MCGRFALDDKVNKQIEQFVLAGNDYRDWTPDEWDRWKPSWNIAPTQPILAVIESGKGDQAPVRRLETARWSFVPSWSGSLSLKFPTFNARSEGMATKPMWREALKSHRALIPASGYYEWQTVGKVKTPYYIRLPDDEMLGLAGLYSWWRDPKKSEDDESRWVLTATILTSDAVHTLEDIHDRNPVPLPREWWDDWVDPRLEGDQAFVDAAVSASLGVAESLRFHQVAPVTGDGPELVEPI